MFNNNIEYSTEILLDNINKNEFEQYTSILTNIDLYINNKNFEEALNSITDLTKYFIRYTPLIGSKKRLIKVISKELEIRYQQLMRSIRNRNKFGNNR